MLRLRELRVIESKEDLKAIPKGKVLINTINAHSYNVAQKDELFSEALRTVHGEGLMDNNSSRECVKYLVPDGASVIKACKWLKAKSQPKERIAGWDLFDFEMKKNCKKRVMFMGSSEKVLARIREKAAADYPDMEVVTYSPPYKPEFSEEDNAAIIKAINVADPDLLWIGMTAPKQEKWTYQHWKELNIGTAQRAPNWWQEHSLEWLFRLIKEPKRMWRRYVIGNPLFLWNISKERI